MTNRRSEFTDGPWIVWGDSGNPILEDVSEEQAKLVVNILVDNGRRDVYAECNDDSKTPDYHPDHVPPE